MSSIKTNFIYKSILTTSTFIISFIIFPYITRVLGAENVGIVNFVDNIINYFVLFASLGISILGVREIASVAHNKELRSEIFFNILGLNMYITCIILVIYILTITLTPNLSQYKELLYIGIGKIIFTTLLVEWFFSGIEEFRYISVRSLIIKLLYTISIFTLIKNKDDYILYFSLTTATVIINALINILYVRKFISLKKFKIFSIRYFQDNLRLGVYLLLNSMYSTFNIVYLGFATDNFQVGYYSTAVKLYSVILAFFSAFTTVLHPRMNIILSENDNTKFNLIIKKTLSIVYLFCIPLILFSVILAPNIIYIIAGNEYTDAIIPMMIIMPTIFMVGLSQVLAVQVITPLKKDSVLLYASIVGALLGIILNLILVPYLKSIGSAITLLLSETSVTLVYIVYVLRKNIIPLYSKLIFKNILYSIPSVIIWILSTIYIKNDFLAVTTAVIAGGGVWLIINKSEIKNLILSK